MPPRSSSEADKIEIELIRSLDDAFMPSAIMSVGFAACGALIVAEAHDSALLLLLIVGLLTSALRLTVARLVARANVRTEPSIAHARHQERRFALVYCAFALMLGLFAARSFMIEAPRIHMVATCLIVGYAAGVAAGVGLRPRIATVSMVLAVAPAIFVGLARLDILLAANALMMSALLLGGIGSLRKRHLRTVEDIRRRLRFAQLARRDALTALPNRLALREWFAERAASNVAVHCLDLDGFKPVNDSYGHPAGDALLAAVAKRLAGTLRDGDLVARVGGDEFVIVQCEVRTAVEAEFLARRLQACLTRPFRIAEHDILISTCIGYVLSTQAQEDLDTLIGLADARLYEAKRLGRDIIRYEDPSVSERAIG